jgi:PAB1-binding protein PBP1
MKKYQKELLKNIFKEIMRNNSDNIEIEEERGLNTVYQGGEAYDVFPNGTYTLILKINGGDKHGDL